MCEPACTWQPMHPRSECECARAEICDRGVTEERVPVCACMRKDPWFEGGGDGLAGDPAFPQQGASGQSLRLWSGFNASPFQGSSGSSCSWRHPGADSAGNESHMAPICSQDEACAQLGQFPGKWVPGEPSAAGPATPGSLPRGGEPQLGRAEGVKSRAAATGSAALDPEPRGCGSAMILVRRLQPPPRALAFNPGLGDDFHSSPSPDPPGALGAGSNGHGVFVAHLQAHPFPHRFLGIT